MSTLLCLNKKSRSGNVDPARYVEKLRALGPVELHYLEDGAEPVSAVAARLEPDWKSLYPALVGAEGQRLARGHEVLRRESCQRQDAPLIRGNPRR